MVRFAVENWSPEYGSPVGDEGVPALDPAVEVDPSIELPASEWRPLRADPAGTATDVLFVDGVRRIDAQVWFDIDGRSSRGIAASFAAGVIRCRDQAVIEQEAVGRGVFAMVGATPIVAERVVYDLYPTPGDEMDRIERTFQGQLGELESKVARQARPAELLVLDGPLSSRVDVPGAVGYIKSHQRQYLPDPLLPVVGQLRPGERTPVFLAEGASNRYSWYLRLPIDLPGHPWAGIARCEIAARGTGAEASAIADRATATLQRFASTPHKDTRAPQNLFPIAGLEQHLRHRLGDREFLYRQLRKAASAR
jgi:hypothetical protein